MREATKTESGIEVKFRSSDSSEFYSILNRIKNIPGRRYKQKTQTWTIPDTKESINILLENNFNLCRHLSNRLKIETTKKVELQFKNQYENLIHFQKEGVQAIEDFYQKDNVCRVLLADEMRLGKTPQSLSWFGFHPELRPLLVVVPATLKINWSREVIIWLNEDFSICNGLNNFSYQNENVTITNYDLLYGDLDFLLQVGYKGVIFDECHYLSNDDKKKIKDEFGNVIRTEYKVKRFEASLYLSRNIEHMIAISGTPMLNRPIDSYPILNMLRKDLFHNKWQYAKNYCYMKNNGFGWQYDRYDEEKLKPGELEKINKQRASLNKILSENLMIRRLRKDYPEYFAKKQPIQIIPIEITNRKDYDHAWNDFLGWLKSKDEDTTSAEKAERLVKLNRLKKLANAGKKESILSWIEMFLNSGEKLVVMAWHKDVIESISNKFGKKCVTLTGKTTQKQKQLAMDRFQHDNTVRLFAGNMQSAGVGVDLTKASTVCFVEFGNKPSEHDQAEDRINGIAQDKNYVDTIYLVAANTIEEDMASNIDKKRKMISQSIDGVDLNEDDFLSTILRKVKDGNIR